MTQPSDPNAPKDFDPPAPWTAAPAGYQPQGQYEAAPSLSGDAARYGAGPQSGMGFPAGVALASSGRRIGGFFLEILLAIVTLGIGYLIWTLIVWGQGQTPGKQVLKMRCYRVQEQRVAHWGWMFLRQFIGGVIYEVTVGIGFLVSAVMLVTRQDRRTIPDFVAGTVVLHDPSGLLR